MNRLIVSLLLAATVAGASAIDARAATETAATAQPSVRGAATSPQVERAVVVTDQKTGTVRIRIDGKDVVVIDSKGLHVHGDIEYQGMMTDVGGADNASP